MNNLLPQNRNWRKLFTKIGIYCYFGIVICEIGMFFMLKSGNQIEGPISDYLKTYLIFPIVINGCMLVLQALAQKFLKKHNTLLDTLPIFTIVTILGITCTIHCLFSGTMSMFCLPITITVAYSNHLITVATTAYSFVWIIISGIYRYASGVITGRAYIVPDVIIALATVFVCAIIAYVISRLMEKNRQELAEATSQAQNANKAKSIFLSNMSHEIRTPMNAIIGMTDIMMRDEHTPESVDYLRNIKNSGNALITIINDILDFSKIESGKLELVSEEYEPAAMISDLSMIFWNRIGEKNIELIFDIDPTLPSRLYGDSLRVRQVIINLLNNAVKFTDSGFVKLTVKLESIDNEEVVLWVSVKDTGRGIREQDLGKLFNSFEQMDIKKDRSIEGTGLGLAISKQLVTLLGGTIGVNSEYGKGSEFYFTIRQKLTDATYSNTLKRDPKSLRIGAHFCNMYEASEFNQLLVSLSIPPAKKTLTEDLDFFFTDDIEFLKLPETRQVLKSKNVTVYHMLNPMQKTTHQRFVQNANKPIYSLNLFRMLNEEVVTNTSHSETIHFTAPQANVLLVDDNAMNLTVAKGLLKPIGMNIDTAINGEEAVAMVKENHYDLILMDHMMPIMDGIEATQAIRAMEDEYYKNLPILALTANALVESCNEFLQNGMNDFIAKPIEIKDICTKLMKWLPPELVIMNEPTDTENN